MEYNGPITQECAITRLFKLLLALVCPLFSVRTENEEVPEGQGTGSTSNEIPARPQETVHLSECLGL